MSLINYVEPINVGSIFVSLGRLIFIIILSYIIYGFYIKLVQYLEVFINRESKYQILEELYLDDLASEKGKNLNKELMKRKMIDSEPTSLRKKIQEEIYKDFIENKDKK